MKKLSAVALMLSVLWLPGCVFAVGNTGSDEELEKRVERLEAEHGITHDEQAE